MSESLTKPTLPTFSWIGQLKDDDRDLLSSYGEFFPGHPGNVIIEEGVLQTEIFVVISGELEVRAKQEDGNESLLARVGPGETLGEISLFDPGPAAATVTAVEFSQLWRIADSDLMQFMEDNPGAGNVLLRTLASILAQRLRQMNPKVFGLSTYAVVESPDLAATPSLTPVELAATEEPVESTLPAAVGYPPVESATGETLPRATAYPPVEATPEPPPSGSQAQRKRTTSKTQAIHIPDGFDIS